MTRTRSGQPLDFGISKVDPYKTSTAEVPLERGSQPQLRGTAHPTETEQTFKPGCRGGATSLQAGLEATCCQM